MNTDDSGFLVKIETVDATDIKAIFGILKDNNIVEANIKITPRGPGNSGDGTASHRDCACSA